MTLGNILLTLLMLVSAFLMSVILLQRGRGGGVAGAFGGSGGQCALGAKACDVFTVVTIVTVVLWVVLACMASARLQYEAAAIVKRPAAAQNAVSPLQQPRVDGNFVVGIASLKADDFLPIVRAAEAVRKG